MDIFDGVRYIIFLFYYLFILKINLKNIYIILQFYLKNLCIYVRIISTNFHTP